MMIHPKVNLSVRQSTDIVAHFNLPFQKRREASLNKTQKRKTQQKLRSVRTSTLVKTFKPRAGGIKLAWVQCGCDVFIGIERQIIFKCVKRRGLEIVQPYRVLLKKSQLCSTLSFWYKHLIIQ